MSVDWPKLIVALAFLLTPAAIFHGRGVHHRDLTRDWRGYWGRTLGLWTHGFDLLRALAGAWLLIEALSRTPGAAGIMKYAPLALRGLLFCTATMLQTVVCRERDAMNAPIAFVTGLALILMPIQAAVPGVVLAVLIAHGTNMRTLFFPVLAFASAGLGALFLGGKLALDTAGAGAAIMLPWLLPVLFRTHLVCAYRARK